MHFLITGHTGFKGAWLTMLLKQRGHIVSGVSLDPTTDSLFNKVEASKSLNFDLRCDIGDLGELEESFKEVKPDVVIHLAAQSLVRESYREPILTMRTNVLGTLNVLRASQAVGGVKAQLIVTTDKVYENVGKSMGYLESDPLGGKDPYSASKAMADIATQSWLASFENPPTAIARAGNVIGGGDICADRLIPDLVHSYCSGQIPQLRAPDSVRPWQHVLDCLNGYLMLVDALIQNNADGAWNFGPDENQSKTVADVANVSGTVWGAEKSWERDLGDHPYEAPMLMLNSSKARTGLGWSEKLTFEESVQWTTNWYKNVNSGSDPLEETLKNIEEFEAK
jgi:CDP-glucose 4,6-dehydratase